MSKFMIQKVFIQTHGCQMNEYDSAKMLNVLESDMGMQVTDLAEEADLLLLNTCSIREKAQEKVFSQLGRWRKLKLAKPELVIGVGGCVASQEGDAIRERAPYVDVVFGPQTLHRLPDMVREVRRSKTPLVDISFPRLKNLIVYLSLKLMGQAHLSRLWRVVASTAPSAWCLIPVERKSVGHLMM